MLDETLLAMRRIEGIIKSMTVAERTRPAIIDGSRRRRIADGSGTDPGAVGALINQFSQAQKMMKNLPGFANPAKRKKKKAKTGKRGGRTTPKGTSPASKKPFVLPGLEGGLGGNGIDDTGSV